MAKATIFITGATSGIGKSAAYRFASNGYRLVITGRRRAKLEELKQILETKYQVEVYILNFDVRNLADVNTAIESLPTEWKKIDILLKIE